MNVRDLVPWTRNNGRDRNLRVSQETSSPLFTLHREMNRLFEDLFRSFDDPAAWTGGPWPQLEVEDAESEYRVTAELPGMEEKDVEVLVQDDVLILRGEKRFEAADRARTFSERAYGRFERRITLDGVDETAARASFRNGVLVVTLPKTARSRERVRRIPIGSTGTAH